MNSKGRQIMNNDIEKILFDQAQLDKRMDEMAAELNQKYEGKQPADCHSRFKWGNDFC